MEITFLSDVQNTIGSFTPGDFKNIHDGTARSLVESGLAVEGKVTKKKLTALLKARAEQAARDDEGLADELLAKADRLAEAGAPASEVDRVLEKAQKAAGKKKVEAD